MSSQLILCTPSQTPLCFYNIEMSYHTWGAPCPLHLGSLDEDILAQLAGNNWASAESSIFLDEVLLRLDEG